jgi:hypothetical protein
MFSPLSSRIKDYFGIKNTIIIGFSIVMVSTIALGTIGIFRNGA